MNTFFNIHGGIHQEEEKHLSNPGTVLDAGLHHSLILPLSQHIGKPSSLCVKPGDYVLGGQLLAEADGMVSVPLHAPTSGTVIAIEPRPVPHPSALDNLCLELACDGEDRWIDCKGCEDWRAETPYSLISRISAAGIAGMGGAGFPTAVKLMARDRLPLTTLIINGTECEPYITADDTLMQVDAAGIVEGAQILARILGVEEILLAVEDNKPAALATMSKAAETAGDHCQVVTFPTKYPSGGEKQLIEIFTGQQVPA